MATKKVVATVKASYFVDALAKWQEENSLDIAVTENTNSEMVLAANAADVAVGLVGVANAKFLMILTDLPITVKLNGGLTAIPVESFLLLTGGTAGTITAITASNPSSTTAANVKILSAE